MNSLDLHTLTQQLEERDRIQGKKPIAYGRWTTEEQSRFLKAIQLRPYISWITVAQIVQTRNARQTRTHAQKHFEKLKRQTQRAKKMADENLLCDTTSSFRALPHVSGASASTTTSSSLPPISDFISLAKASPTTPSLSEVNLNPTTGNSPKLSNARSNCNKMSLSLILETKKQ